jgi:hypothetical protein
MKKLIVKILREEFSRQIISIKYVGRKSLIESTNYEYIDQDILNLINLTHMEQQGFANANSPLLAQYVDKRTKQLKKAYFNILIDKHFTERNYRPETFPSDPNLVKVDINEGINVVIENINKIWQTISILKFGYSDVLRLKTLNGVNYEILVSLRTPNQSDKIPTYDIVLYNQIKGVNKHFKKEKNIINVYNPIDKK